MNILHNYPLRIGNKDCNQGVYGGAYAGSEASVGCGRRAKISRTPNRGLGDFGGVPWGNA